MAKIFIRDFWLLVGLTLLLSACGSLSPSSTAAPKRAVSPTPTANAPSVTLSAPDASPVPATFTATPYIWPTPPPSPTPVCPGAPRTRLIVQERGRVLPDDPRPVNVREGPGTDKSVRALMPIRAVFFVLDGPVCNNDYSWFRIRYDGKEGWIAEGDTGSYYVEPYFPG